MFHAKQNSLKEDPTAESRKKDHIDLAFKSQLERGMLDNRFYYEPILSGHPKDVDLSVSILNYKLNLPIWISSMTGGTEMANTINRNLARACGEFGMGMGLGSCRSLLDSNERISDFSVRSLMPNQPLYANLGVAQLETLIETNQLEKIQLMVDRLEADGLIIHVNPLQEWLQPEGDRYFMSPQEIVVRVLERFPELNIIVKEVGQGMGPQSLKALYTLPIQAVDFAAGGGTNFSKLELHRADDDSRENYSGLTNIGHSAEEMVLLSNRVQEELGEKCLCKETIISGGVKHYLDGYYLMNKINSIAIYGQASSFLKHATGEYEALRKHVIAQEEGLKMATTFLTIKER